jgi:hypothetical protein
MDVVLSKLTKLMDYKSTNFIDLPTILPFSVMSYVLD